jgi:hypothetical protein
MTKESWTAIGKRPRGAGAGTWVSLARRRVAFLSKTQAFVDGEPGEAFDEVRDFEFSPDGTRTAYVAVRGADDHRVIVDGRAGPKWDFIGFNNLVFSPSGRRVAYTAMRQRKHYVIVDDEAYGPFDEGQVGEGYALPTLAFAGPDEKVLYCGKRNGRAAIELSGQRAAREYEMVRDAMASCDGHRVAYRARRDGKWFIIIDDVEHGPFEKADDLVLSADGAHAAFTAGDVVVLDGVAQEKHARVGQLRLSARGGVCAYEARDVERNCFVVHGTRPGPKFTNVLGPTLSHEGDHIAYVATEDNCSYFVVRDGQREGSYSNIFHLSLTFSHDGKHLAYLVKGEDRVVVDGIAGEACTGIYGGILFSADGGNPIWVAERADEVFVVERKLR